MNETRYMISEAAKITQVEAHVLRYWEEELKLPIGRNEMGHRYYTEKDIQTFRDIKELKKQGLQLRMIREKLHQTENRKKNTAPKIVAMHPGSDTGEKTKEEQFQEILERLLCDLEQGDKKEGRYRRLDEAIRQRQQSRKMVAATEEHTKKRQRRMLSLYIENGKIKIGSK